MRATSASGPQGCKRTRTASEQQKSCKRIEVKRVPRGLLKECIKGLAARGLQEDCQRTARRTARPLLEGCKRTAKTLQKDCTRATRRLQKGYKKAARTLRKDCTRVSRGLQEDCCCPFAAFMQSSYSPLTAVLQSSFRVKIAEENLLPLQ